MSNHPQDKQQSDVDEEIERILNVLYDAVCDLMEDGGGNPEADQAEAHEAIKRLLLEGRIEQLNKLEDICDVDSWTNETVNLPMYEWINQQKAALTAELGELGERDG